MMFVAKFPGSTPLTRSTVSGNVSNQRLPAFASETVIVSVVALTVKVGLIEFGWACELKNLLPVTTDFAPLIQRVGP